MRSLTLLPVVALAACNAVGGGPNNPARETALQLAEGRSCPLPVAERDALLASAISEGDTAPLEAFLSQRPDDPTARAVASTIAGEPVVDPDQLACIAPYL